MSSYVDSDDLLDLVDRRDIIDYLKRGRGGYEEEPAIAGSDPLIDETFMQGSALAGDLVEVLYELRQKHGLLLVEKLRELL